MNVRKYHRWVSIGSFLFLTTTAVTGLLWAYAPHLYWRDGYKEVKHKDTGPDFQEARLSIADVLARASERYGNDNAPIAITLRQDAGCLVYEVRTRTADGKKQAGLLDAISGEWRSPLSETDAIRFSRQYVAGAPDVTDALLLSDWIERGTLAKRAAWRVRFGDEGATEIYLDPATGAILEDQDQVRRLHFLIMRLHMVQFFGTKKTLTIVSGLPLLVLVSTGAWLAFGKTTALRRRASDSGHGAQDRGCRADSASTELDA